MFIEFRTVENTWSWSANVTFYTVLLRIRSDNCLQKNWRTKTSVWFSYCKANKGAIFCLTVYICVTG